MKIKGYHRTSIKKFSDLTFDRNFNQSMELLNSDGLPGTYRWNFRKITSSIINQNYHENTLNIYNNSQKPGITIDSYGKNDNNSVQSTCTISPSEIMYEKTFRDDNNNISITKTKHITLERNYLDTSINPTSIGGYYVSEYNDLIQNSEISLNHTTSTPESHISTKYTPKVTYDSNTSITTVSLQEEDVTLSRLANTDGNYILPENAEIHFGEQYKASKERIIIPLRTVHESVSVGGNTFQEYYQDPNDINYIITTDRNLVAIGTITDEAIGVTEVLPKWNRFSIFKRDDDTVSDHYDQLYGLMMFFAESSSSYEIIVPQSCQLLSLENYRGKIDVSNCALVWDSYVDIVNCTNGTLIISSEQEESLGERIVNGRLCDGENGIQVEVKP